MLTLGEAIQSLFSIPRDEVTLHRLRMAWLDERALRHLRDVPDGPHPSLIIQIAHPLGPRRGWGRVDCDCLCGLRTGDALAGTTVFNSLWCTTFPGVRSSRRGRWKRPSVISVQPAGATRHSRSVCMLVT